MYVDQRYLTISAWPILDDSDTVIRAFVQLCDLITDPRQPHERRQAIKLLLQLRPHLTSAHKVALRNLAERLRMTSRFDSWFDERAAGPFSPLPSDHSAAVSAPTGAPHLVRPDAPTAMKTNLSATLKSGHQVGELIRRIEHFQGGQPTTATYALSDGFDWLTDACGFFTEGVAEFAPGVVRLNDIRFDERSDIMRAISRHTAFTNQRGQSPAGAAFILSAQPIFDADSGTFRGYRGHACPDGEASALGIPAAVVAEVAHEVRTPLNAILGYAEMIEQQVLGPAPASYRDDARAIIDDARRLLAAVDGLGDAAALEEGRAVRAGTVSEPDDLLALLKHSFVSLSARRNVALHFKKQENAAPLKAEPDSVYRAASRLLTAIIAFTAERENITISFGPSELCMTRPKALRGQSEKTLLTDTIDNPEGRDAPLLGLAFTLRILRRLAEANGGRFAIEPDVFVLQIPDGRDIEDVQAS